PQYSQPICTALQIALVELLKSFELIPSAVICHPSGEISAAYAAGALSHESACQVAYFRGVHAGDLASSVSYRGSMMAYITSEMKIKVACINSPRSITFSREEGDITYVQTILNGKRIFAASCKLVFAYHSPQM
ncbi:FabD/lysophospholipase-like protein, partial [Zopfia rhizophila CBS 207.26]